MELQGALYYFKESNRKGPSPSDWFRQFSTGGVGPKGGLAYSSNWSSGTYFFPLKAKLWASLAAPCISGIRILDPFITTLNPKGTDGSVSWSIWAMEME